MMALGDRDVAPDAGGPERHVPVLLKEVLEWLAPQPGEVIVDGTFGAGGYSRAILERGAHVIGIDRDPDAIAGGQELVKASEGRLMLVPGQFAGLETHARGCGFDGVDGVVLDLGVSSMQLDEADRGFSFLRDGPLDMRMEQAGPSAADVVNELPVKDLIRVIGLLGEEKRATTVAHAIDRARKEKPFTRTLELANLIEKVLGRSPKKAQIHPATRTFQALRIYVNGELHQAAEALGAAERILKPGGRLVLVSFHSLEDRIVKRFFQDRTRTRGGGSRHMPEEDVPPATFELLTRKAVEAADAETDINPRARSAKLRAGRRTEAEARELDIHQAGVPRLAAFHGLGG
ncbi:MULTISPECIES: 16S rRNA (cytosine(1402)-N(4))-methyltransferase RsmH [Stappiaceae]|mgnify:CR=1 FL=1|jgi:16S rRNA (cytosine1402-N4)-methyltransferase|uniref:Ribosomal RNA small subunit methyltransferase H n=2 Tax=Roseibium TaxID=150830 RepID=A0A0M6Y2Z4_9HYPH|nr:MULTISPECIES: 16S rRNA (cytosine(1402)-N(4))-methyltransferase RsmH [Stappiaceae]MCR9284497.1 16S rRNA (cytosine(1402)-N(4))-methyltransferase RsmH [Paracoccaceae bacterium]MEC9419330.1 16S rRNA (cytosine(1402)-N(4))-methyltransferase RsmH [Pseudomonadota bacterium]ERP93655.1 16S rRNA methyltransferase [Labrenzia sp. C1B10]ERS05520.1 16S rRNA methyltransferase [Labrenzia sp. C1B70]MEC9472002.1 16S rRNA (cytosine(1402)-N(4))-methyltransferase RsmH [Pseudomonadota bacterium]